jgi:hypothetical protein
MTICECKTGQRVSYYEWPRGARIAYTSPNMSNGEIIRVHTHRVTIKTDAGKTKVVDPENLELVT